MEVGPLPRANFHVYRGKNVGTAHNCQNFDFWPEICTSGPGATRLQYFYEIFSFCTRL